MYFTDLSNMHARIYYSLDITKLHFIQSLLEAILVKYSDKNITSFALRLTLRRNIVRSVNNDAVFRDVTFPDNVSSSCRGLDVRKR